MGFGERIRKLFRRDPDSQRAPPTEYRGYLITPTPQRSGAEFHTCGEIARTVGAETRTARFIRADRHGSEEQAMQHAIQKGRQIIDELGDDLFERNHL